MILMESHLNKFKLNQIIINDHFWSPRLDSIKNTTIPYIFDCFEQCGAFENFDNVTKGHLGKHKGYPFFDGLIFETIRATSDFLASDFNEILSNRLDEYIKRIDAAQSSDQDGYLNTYVTLMKPDCRWGSNGGDQLWHHEVYNAGCLVEAGVHHYLATNKINLLKLSVKFANYMCDYMGQDPKHNVIPTHSLPEEALLKLFLLFSDERSLKDRFDLEINPKEYINLVDFWINNRGNHKGRINFQEYAQDHKNILYQEEAVGHAVRATLLYNGLTFYGIHKPSNEHLEQSKIIWDNVVEKKMHITGGVGAIHQYEGFGHNYFLPEDGYLESCAGVGLAFWASNMNIAFGNSCYSDVFEKVVYNNIITGVSLSGDSFFYQNPLKSNGGHHRWSNHDCPCCPPMISKLLASIQENIYTYKKDGIYINHFIGGKINFMIKNHNIELSQTSNYPWDGDVLFKMKLKNPIEFNVGIRIPDWCKYFSLKLNNISFKEYTKKDGYIIIKKFWNNNDTLEFSMEMKIQKIVAHPNVVHLKGKVAIQRGPLIYCIESFDNNESGMNFSLNSETEFKIKIDNKLLKGVKIIKGKTSDGKNFRALPYFLWDHRRDNLGLMKVWINQQDLDELLSKEPFGNWDKNLYRSLEEI